MSKEKKTSNKQIVFSDSVDCRATFTRKFKKTLLVTLLVTLLTMLTLAVTGAADGDDLARSKNIDKSIEKGLNYLYENQLPGGDFPLYRSYYPEMSPKEKIPVLFDTTFVVHTLNLAEGENTEEIVDEMKSKANAFLLDNKLPHGVWKWQNISFLLPDTDDTSMAFAALVESGVDISDESLDYMLDFKTQDGIFYTYINSEEWLDPSNPVYEFFKNNDIDPNVNADILYAYSLRNRTQIGIIQYLNNIAENKSFINGTIYYPSPYVFTYMVTRDYSDGNIKELEPSLIPIRDYILAMQKPDGGWGNAQDTALATVSLLNMDYKGVELEKAIKHILSTQREDGSWNMYAFYMDTYTAAIFPGTPTIYFGSQELTTAFNIESLIKYQKTLDKEEEKGG